MSAPRKRTVPEAVEFEVPVRTWPTPNIRWHWAKRAKVAKVQRESAAIAFRAAEGRHCSMTEDWRCWEFPLGVQFRVTLTRVAPRPIKDRDNLIAGLKSVRDGIADYMGRDDAESGAMQWRYEQAKGRPKYYSVRVRVERVEDGGLLTMQKVVITLAENADHSLTISTEFEPELKMDGEETLVLQLAHHVLTYIRSLDSGEDDPTASEQRNG